MTGGIAEVAQGAAIGALWVGLGIAAYRDWVAREVSDALWILLALVGGAAAFTVLAASGVGPLGELLWIVLGLFVIEHLLPWDEALARRWESLPGVLEVILYLGLGAALAGLAIRDGVGPSGVPVAVLAGYLGVVFARALFEIGLLYGGADAKALMVAGFVVPIFASPWIPLPAAATTLLAFYPFAVTLLMDAAVFSITIPLGLALRNVARGEFEFPRAFIGYRLDVVDLADRFVWLRDPTFQRGARDEEAETSADDRALRVRQRDELLARGIRRVWVTPQLPYVVFLALGAVAGIVAGNLIFDLAALL
jgi:preflagellin peptidase FlaK